MRRLIACCCLLAALPGCGGDWGDSLEAARYLHPEAQLVATVDLDYGGGQWKQVQDVYKRAAEEFNRHGSAGEKLPETLEGFFDQFTGGGEVSFQEDVRPLPKGHLLIGVHVTPGAGRTWEQTGVEYP